MGNLHRVMVIADGDNAFMAAQNFNRKIDWHKMRNYLADPKEGRELIEMVIYLGLPPARERFEEQRKSKEKFVYWARSNGFLVVAKEGKAKGDDYENNVDVVMAIDAIELSLEIKPDIVVLVTGDSDFAYLAEKLRRLYSDTEKFLCTAVQELSRSEGLPKTPVVGIELCDDNPNAYAVGATRSYAMVVATTGLIKHLNQRQVAAVMAHELGHIANLDTMAKTLLSSALDGVMLILFKPMLLIVWYFGRFAALLMLGAGLIYGLLGNWQHATVFFVGVLVWILLMMLPTITRFLVTLLTFWHSRWREYHADAVAARLTSVDDIVSALATLDRLPFQPPKTNKEQMATLWIRVAMKEETGTFHWLKHTHPPIHKRIEALRRGFYLR